MRFRGADIARDIRDKYGFDGDLSGLFAGHEGPEVHKWHHYIPLYDRYLSHWRGRPVRFLEIGVAKGGSLNMWRRYLGRDAVIFGIAVDPSCAAFDGQAGAVRIGSQDDPDLLMSVVDEMGGVDVVLDDGSHEMDHIRASLAALFPRLPKGGLYMIEDLHAAYWPAFGGGLDAAGNFFNDIRRMIDHMHVWYYDEAVRGQESVPSGIHIHDSFVVLEKHAVYAPVHSRVGGISKEANP